MRISVWNEQLSRLTLLGVTLVTFMSVAAADTLQVLTSASDTVCIGTSTPPFCGVSYFQETQDSTGTALLNGTFGPTSSQETVSADAHSAFGILNASASSSFDVSGTPESIGVTANATVEDIITISDPSLDGETGFLDLSYSLDGTISGSAFAVVVVKAGTSLEQQSIQEYDSSVSGTFSIPAPIQFVYGQPFGLSLYLGAAAGNATGYGELAETTGSGSGSAQFFDTLVLTGLVPLDSNGNPVADAEFSSQSGTRYSVNGVVPEPSGLVPLLLLLAILVVAKHQSGRIREV